MAASFTARADQGTLLAAASSLRTLWPALTQAYTAETGHQQPRVSFGSSGLLSTQIINGAPFELFLSADQDTISRIPQQRLAAPPRVFALGALRIVVPANSVLANQLSMETLAKAVKQQGDKTAFRIAIPNPVHAPYGRAARTALESARLWPLPEGGVLAAENAAQTLQFVRTGAVDAAILPQSLVYDQPRDLVSVEVPPDSYQRVEHVLAIFTPEKTPATNFSRWLFGTSAQTVLRDAGLQMTSQ